MLWRRRNKKLTARLNTVVETAEEVCKSYKPKPRRVVIDTSYVEQNHPDEYHDGSAVEPHGDRHDRHSVPETEIVTNAEPDVFSDSQAGNTELSADDGNPQSLGSSPPEIEGEELNLLNEALALLEQAEQREAAALEEATTLGNRLKRAETNTRSEKAARLRAEAQAEEAAQIAADALNETTILQEAAKLSEQAVREAEANASSDELAEMHGRIEQLEAQIAEEQTSFKDTAEQLQETLQAYTELQEQSVALDVFTDLQSNFEHLDAEISKFEAARLDAEAQRDEALQTLDDERATAITQEQIDELQTQIEQFETTASQELANRLGVEAELKDALHAITIADEEISALQDGAELNADREIEAGDREASAQQEIANLHNRIELIEAERMQDQSTRHELEAQLAAVIQDAAGAQEELLPHQQMVERLQLAEHREGEARSLEAEAKHKIIELEIRIKHFEAVVIGEREAHDKTKDQLEQALQGGAATAQQLTQANDAPEQFQDLAPVEEDSTELATEDLNNQLDVSLARVGELEAEIAQEQLMRRDVEAQLDDAVQNASSAQEQLAYLNEALAQSQSAEQVASEQSSSDIDFEAEIAEWRQRTQEATDVIAQEQAARVAVESQLEDAEQNAVAAHEQILVLQDALEYAQQAQLRAVQSTGGKVPVRDASEDLRFAADRPVFIKATKRKQPKAAKPEASKAAGAKPERKEKRVSTRISGTVQKDTELTVLTCTVIDQSSGGAKIDIVPDKYNASIGMPDVGDDVTLTFKTLWEVNTVSCEVMWLAGTLCGVKYTGHCTKSLAR